MKHVRRVVFLERHADTIACSLLPVHIVTHFLPGGDRTCQQVCRLCVLARLMAGGDAARLAGDAARQAGGDAMLAVVYGRRGCQHACIEYVLTGWNSDQSGFSPPSSSLKISAASLLMGKTAKYDHFANAGLGFPTRRT